MKTKEPVKTSKPVPQKQPVRPREDVLASSRVNILGNDMCRLVLLLRDKLNCFNETELRGFLREELNRAGHDPVLTLPEDLWMWAILEGVDALKAMLPLIHEKMHGATLPVPKDHDAY